MHFDFQNNLIVLRIFSHKEVKSLIQLQCQKWSNFDCRYSLTSNDSVRPYTIIEIFFIIS